MRSQAAVAVQVESDDGIGCVGAMRELENLRREVVRELMDRPGVERFKRLALYVEAVDVSLDALMGMVRKSRQPLTPRKARR